MFSICCNSDTELQLKIRKKFKKISQIQLFMNQYTFDVKNYLSAVIESKIFEENNPAIAFNVLSTKSNKKIYIYIKII